MKGGEENANGARTDRGESRGRGKFILCFDEVEAKLLFGLVRYAVGARVDPPDLLEQDQGDELVARIREFLWSLARAHAEQAGPPAAGGS